MKNAKQTGRVVRSTSWTRQPGRAVRSTSWTRQTGRVVRSTSRTRQPGEAAGACRTARAGGWAAVYLLAAGTLIALAGSELSGPSPDKRAGELERETARDLAALVETASRLAESQAEDNRRRASQRRATLDTALAAARSWARRLEGRADHADVEAELSRAAGYARHL